MGSSLDNGEIEKWICVHYSLLQHLEWSEWFLNATELLQKCLWNQLCCHYLLACLDPKIKQEPTTATKYGSSSSEKGLCNWCKVPSSADVPSWSHMLGEKSSMHLKNSSCSHSEHCWTVIQCIWKGKKSPRSEKIAPLPKLKELKDLPSTYTSNVSCSRALKIQFQFFILYAFCSCIRFWFSQ